MSALLFQPLQLKSVLLKNRIVVSPMCEYSSEDGYANDWHLVHLGSRAVGGAGLILTEAAAVSPEGRISPDDLGIWKDEHIEGLLRINNFIADQGCVPGIQLAHAGRKASTSSPWKGHRALSVDEGGWQTVAPTAIPYNQGEPVPEALDESGIQKCVDNFKTAALRSLQAGFKVLEIHAAHGYLIHQFLSPITNKRADSYGGSFENRTRFLMQILEAIKSAWDVNLPVFVRISATDWISGGWTITDSILLANELKARGVDLIDCSSGGIAPEQIITAGPLYQVPFAEAIKKQAGIATGAVGLITTADQAEAILEKQRADLIFLARQSLRDPYFPLHAAQELGANIPWPSQYERAKKTS